MIGIASDCCDLKAARAASTGAMEPKAPGSGRLFKGSVTSPLQSIATNKPLDSTDTRQGQGQLFMRRGKVRAVQQPMKLVTGQ